MKNRPKPPGQEQPLREAYSPGDEIKVKILKGSIEGIVLDAIEIDPLKSRFNQYVLIAYISNEGKYLESNIVAALIFRDE
jgi:D-alanine-D-alanine ligase-like ATP-grasp enzyme